MNPKMWNVDVWFSVAFTVLAIVTAVVNPLGYTDWTPPAGLVEAVGVLCLVINLLVRRFLVEPKTFEAGKAKGYLEAQGISES